MLQRRPQDDFIRLIEHDGVRLQVAVVEWDVPHVPTLRWHTFQEWPHAPEPDELQEAKQRALSDVRFFRTCTICLALNNTGHMHDDEACQACAAEHLGVIY